MEQLLFFRDILDVPSYPQSFDIAVSPDLSLRNSKSQGKGDRSRRERYNLIYNNYN